MEKLCVFCKHFSWRASESGTYGWTEKASCNKGHEKHYWWQPEDESAWRKILIDAQTCPDYAPPQTQEK